jgi:tRNA(Ile)-lysidine synthase
MELAHRVLATIRRHGLVPRGGRAIVALSGGPDSVVLVHLLLELHRLGELTVAGLAHFNHQLRGADADADEAFCVAMAAALDLPIERGRADVRTLAREQGRSVEDAARLVRYAFLDAARTRHSADVVATGHSLDDQAETFLLRLLRGSGPRGLAGIRPRSGRIVRPMLEIPRQHLRAYAQHQGLAWREDATNADLDIPRNRVRHELIPYLEREFSPGIAAVLAREAAIAREDEDRLHDEAIDLASSDVLSITRDHTATPTRVEIDCAALTSLHPALAARVARHALALLAPTRFIGFDHVDRFLQFARGDGRGLSLPGQHAARVGGTLVLGPAPARGPRVPANSFRVPLSIPGEVRLDAQGWAISAERSGSAEPVSALGPARAPSVAVAAGPLQLPLAIRLRRAGDRFRPLGLAHGKKLQDFMVDRKIPRITRDSLPLVVDSRDRIVWVVGESVAEDFRVTEPAREVILLKARRLGGLG